MKTGTRAGMAWVMMVIGLVGPLAAQEPEGGQNMAVRMETMAATLHEHAERWRDAAILYEAAAGLRPEGDADAQKDLFRAAQLYLVTGGVGPSIAALESAASRALSVGDAVLARERFADAALVAQHAGLGREYRRLSNRVTDLSATIVARADAGGEARVVGP